MLGKGSAEVRSSVGPASGPEEVDSFSCREAYHERVKTGRALTGFLSSKPKPPTSKAPHPKSRCPQPRSNLPRRKFGGRHGKLELLHPKFGVSRGKFGVPHRKFGVPRREFGVPRRFLQGRHGEFGGPRPAFGGPRRPREVARAASLCVVPCPGTAESTRAGATAGDRAGTDSAASQTTADTAQSRALLGPSSAVAQADGGALVRATSPTASVALTESPMGPRIR